MPGRPRNLTRTALIGALLAPMIFTACSFSNPFRSSQSGYVAPRSVGEGDCSVEVVNLSGRPLEAFFFFGMRNPPRVISGWPRLGLLEPGESSIIHGDCDERRIQVHAYATGPVDRRREYTDVRRDVALVEGRREVVRLRLAR